MQTKQNMQVSTSSWLVVSVERRLSSRTSSSGATPIQTTTRHRHVQSVASMPGLEMATSTDGKQGAQTPNPQCFGIHRYMSYGMSLLFSFTIFTISGVIEQKKSAKLSIHAFFTDTNSKKFTLFFRVPQFFTISVFIERKKVRNPHAFVDSTKFWGLEFGHFTS